MLKLMGIYQWLTWWNSFMNWIFHLWDMYMSLNVCILYVKATIVMFACIMDFLVYTILVAKGIYIYIIINKNQNLTSNMVQKYPYTMQQRLVHQNSWCYIGNLETSHQNFYSLLLKGERRDLSTMLLQLGMACLETKYFKKWKIR